MNLIRLYSGLRMERRRLVLPWDYLSVEMKRWILRAIGHELPEGGNVLKPQGQKIRQFANLEMSDNHGRK